MRLISNLNLVRYFPNQMRELAKSMGNKDARASPNSIFGLQEYEYLGQCPECNEKINCFWRGKDSYNKIQGVMVAPKSKVGMIPVPQKTVSELEKLNNNMIIVDDKMKTLHDSSTKETNIKSANDELMQTLGNLNKKLKTL